MSEPESEKSIPLGVFWIGTVVIALGGGLSIGYDHGKQDPAKAAFQAGKLEGFEMADKGYSAQLELIQQEW